MLRSQAFEENCFHIRRNLFKIMAMTDFEDGTKFVDDILAEVENLICKTFEKAM